MSQALVTKSPPKSPLEKLRRQLEHALSEDLKLQYQADPHLPEDARASQETLNAWQHNKALHIREALALITIDPELRDLIPPPLIGEREKLAESLKAEGVRDALVLWVLPDGTLTLLDGHTRRETILAEGLPFDVALKHFETRVEAKQWMITNQLGRRNLSPEQRTYLLGCYYNATKEERGGDRKSEKSKAQNEPLISRAEQIAEEQGVSREQVKRAGKVAQAVDRLGEQNPEAKAAVLAGKAPVTKGELQGLADAPDEVIAEAAAALTREPAAPSAEGAATVVLIACSAEKLTRLGPVPARELYQGDLFKKSVEWAELQQLRWYVLSAKHGAVGPDQMLEPYNLKITDLKSKEAGLNWSNMVLQQLGDAGVTDQTPIVFLTGQEYQNKGNLLVRLKFKGGERNISAPLTGIGGIGHQKAWLLEQIKDLKEKLPIERWAPEDVWFAEQVTTEQMKTYLSDPDRARAYIAFLSAHPVSRLDLFEHLESAFDYCPSVARELLLQYWQQLDDNELEDLQKKLEEMGQARLTAAELKLEEVAPPPPSEAVIAAGDYDLTDATEARVYLRHIAKEDKAAYPEAMELVIAARPAQLEALWKWALEQHQGMTSSLEWARLKTLCTRALKEISATPAEAPAAPPVEAEAMPAPDLTDDAAARTFLQGIAENDPTFFTMALERVIEARPAALPPIYGWVCVTFAHLMSATDKKRLDALYREALREPSETASAPKGADAPPGAQLDLTEYIESLPEASPASYLLPPPELQLCKTHKGQACAHWVIAGEQMSICRKTYTKPLRPLEGQDLKDAKICFDCALKKRYYELPLEPFALNIASAQAYLARQEDDNVPRALEQVLQACHAVAQAAVDQLAAEGRFKGYSWTQGILARYRAQELTDPCYTPKPQAQ